MPTRKQINEGVPTVPPRVKSLAGCRFGALVVQFFAGQDKHGKALWCCTCDCGVTCRVSGSRLLGTRSKDTQKSCGHLRADPGIRRAARLNVPAKTRAEICAKMRKAVRTRQPAYSMDAHRAAELLGVSMERITVLVADGILGSTLRKGALWVSSRDVSTLLAMQERQKKRCPAKNAWLAKRFAAEASSVVSK
jgi:hypothetical protein